MGLGSDLGLFGRSVTVAPQLGRSGFWMAEVTIAPESSMANVPRVDRVGVLGAAAISPIRGCDRLDLSSSCP